MDPAMVEELKLKLGAKWGKEGMTWDRVVKLTKDILGITTPAMMDALHKLRQGENTPADTFVARMEILTGYWAWTTSC